MKQKEKLKKLEVLLSSLYTKNPQLSFHGWKHVDFVRNKAILFAKELNADLFLVESAALMHDLDRFVQLKIVKSLNELRNNIFAQAGYSSKEREKIEKIVDSSHLIKSSKKLSKESESLHDADTLFKALPITPILFTNKYLDEQKRSLFELAERIVQKQEPLLKSDCYFYTKSARKYLPWARTNLALWKNVLTLQDDEDILELLR